MLITYLRSSSYNTYDMCQLKYYLEYTLGRKTYSGKAAIKGSIVHKALEILGTKKLASQSGLTSFYDDELSIKYDVDALNSGKAIDRMTIDAYNHYSKNNTHLEWEGKDEADCVKWVHKVLDYEDGSFSPLNRRIVEVEHFFDLEIKEPWAEYDFTIGEKRIQGNLAIRGTIDLITSVSENPKVYEVIDWKTGKYRKDWAKDKEKNYDEFRDDFQIRLYHYALARNFPDVETFVFTVFFVNVDGPHTVFFSKNDIPETMIKLKERFLEIKNNQKPTRIKGNFKCRWCDFSKNRHDICDKAYNQIIKLGIDRTTSINIREGALTSYSGGGKNNT